MKCMSVEVFIEIQKLDEQLDFHNVSYLKSSKRLMLHTFNM